MVFTNTTPKVIKSDLSIDEINKQAQDRLKHRINEDTRKFRYEYGAPKQKKEPPRHVVRTKRFNAIPHFT